MSRPSAIYNIFVKSICQLSSIRGSILLDPSLSFHRPVRQTAATTTRVEFRTILVLLGSRLFFAKVFQGKYNARNALRHHSILLDEHVAVFSMRCSTMEWASIFLRKGLKGDPDREM